MGVLTRIKGSKELEANIGYADGIEVRNDFDTKYPWNEFEIIEEANGDKFLRIPKFYTHYILDDEGCITGREFSLYKVDNDWVVNNIFIKDGNELPYIDIGCYLGSLDEAGCLRSISGVYPQRKTTIDAMREAAAKCNEYGDNYEYQLFDIWCANLLQDLFVVEFAESCAANIMKGYTYTGYSSKFIKTGETDNIPYVTGTENEIKNDLGTSCMKYRSIENLYGNGQTVLDHIDCDRGKITVTVDGKEVICKLTAPTNGGMIKKLKLDETTRLVFPSVFGANAVQAKYEDVYTGADKDDQLFILGRNNNNGNSLFTLTAYPKKDVITYGVYRLVRRPKTF